MKNLPVASILSSTTPSTPVSARPASLAPRPPSPRAIVPLLACASLLLSTPARASDDRGDLELGPALDRRDTPLHDLWDAPAPGSSLWVAVQASLTERSGHDREFGALLLVGVPLERLYRRHAPVRASHVIADPAHEPARSDARREPEPSALPKAPAAGEAGQASAQEAPPRALVKVTPQVAREAVRAALRHARLEAPDARLDALATRARMGSLLPELRLRATRLVDEAQTLSPTEYDPERITATGGASLWLEARCTWRLDRLVFADEEMAIERMRHDRAEAALKRTDRVLDLLLTWQRAVLAQAAPESSAEEALKASLKAIETEAALDVLTGGWFSRWRAKQP